MIRTREGVSHQRKRELVEEENDVISSKNFEAMIRYQASSMIVTIPVKVARDLRLKLGDRVTIHVQKKRDASLALTSQKSAKKLISAGGST